MEPDKVDPRGQREPDPLEDVRIPTGETSLDSRRVKACLDYCSDLPTETLEELLKEGRSAGIELAIGKIARRVADSEDPDKRTQRYAEIRKELEDKVYFPDLTGWRQGLLKRLLRRLIKAIKRIIRLEAKDESRPD